MRERKSLLVCGAAMALGWLMASVVEADPPGQGCRDPVPFDLEAEEPGILAPYLDELVGWIALNTSYDVRTTYRDPPSVSFCAPGETIVYEGADLIVDAFLNAAYDLPARHIFLVAPWSGEDLFDRSVLLHELIHDVQFLNRDWDCNGAPEWEAYRLQDRWLAEHGIEHDFNWFAIYTLSRCPDEVHP